MAKPTATRKTSPEPSRAYHGAGASWLCGVGFGHVCYDADPDAYTHAQVIGGR